MVGNIEDCAEVILRVACRVDVDFAAMMIPHHQGAIDMAKIVLAHGKDPAIRKLAEEVIAAQDTEIAMMRKWLASKGK